MDETLTIPARFCGPPTSGNGGYTAGLLAAHVGSPVVEVTLRRPPPLDTPLAVVRDGDTVRLLDGDALVAEARPAVPDVDVPGPVPPEEAARASERAPVLAWSPFGTCFTCGPDRTEGDGLRIFAGPTGDGVHGAAPWTPAFGDGEGRVEEPVVWAALDCPGYGVLPAGTTALLGRITAEVRERPRVGEPHVIVARLDGADGRKRHTTTALYAPDGRLLGWARAVWILVDPPHS
ncbi:MAG: hypothetical protein M5U14_08030 [Acidimicrobiia bacterium]|nr:hypothetical protein [Acidimicrobiia bacterium]